MVSEIRPKLFNPVSGTVRTTTGTPIAGVMVIGSDLNYVETDANGYFEFKNADNTLVFWCTGFRPQPQLVPRQMDGASLEVVLSTL